jgi:methionyl-tRNA formyltransferase
MRIIFFGTPEFAVPSLKRLLEAGYAVVTVVTQPDRVRGRGRKTAGPPVKELALLKGIPVMQPAGIKSLEFAREIAALRPDAAVVVAYGKILPLSLLTLPPLGCINVHASLLPKYRGAAPIQRAIMNGEAKTGITTMRMDEGLDTGDILLREETEIEEEDNAYTLSARLSEIGASLLVRTLAGLNDRSIRPVPQSGEPSYAPPLSKEEGRIRWSLPAREIADLIRGTYPWPGAYCFLKGERITILRAKAAAEDGTAGPGKIERVSEREFLVGTGKGTLAVTEVKPDGRKAMSAADFSHGRHLREGICFDLA